MKYYPIHMHLHCSHEPTASLGSTMSLCKNLGIMHMWTTEHDVRMGKKKRDVPEFRFSEKELFITLPSGAKAGFKEEENGGSYAFEETGNALALSIKAQENEKESLLFYSKDKAHADPLFSKLTVELGADIDVKESGQVRVEFILSAQPPTYTQARLCYVLGDMPQKSADELVQYMPFPKKENGVYVFALSLDASEEIGGLDNALCNIRLIAENGGEILFHSFAFRRELNFEEVRQEQIKLAKRLSQKWGVQAFVGFEITHAGNHKNVFSTKVPVINYESLGYKVSNEYAIEHVKKHGGIFSWNHPFTRHRHLENKAEAFEMVVSELLETRVYGASVIEVGFPIGRDTFEAKDYLRLWDRLSEKGIFITGNGDSDNHHAREDCWTEGNNFCSFAGLYDDEEPTEEHFVKALKRGSLWAGNPVVIKNLVFSADGKEQGSVIKGERACVAFSASDIQCGGYAVCITNGKEIERIPIENGRVAGSWTLSCENEYNFARVEIYSDENVLIAFSNPIYLVHENTKIQERDQ
ncbi:MAG: CehA/McbA family metallohydrolase [Clostridia bacterium]|nr:CehA/McbA family metallohydrolase [Clostridia bacterium]